MRTITIEIAEPGDERRWFDVVLADGRRCDGLTWDEMLGQVVALTHPRLDATPHYRMLTTEEWEADRQRLQARVAEANPEEQPTST